MTEREMIEALAATLVSCRECGQPATWRTETAEWGYYLYYCDDHKQSYLTVYPEEGGLDPCPEDFNQPEELQRAALVRKVTAYLRDKHAT